MKFRKDFVTNSSSSSYICEICGRVESGWDMCCSDAGMCECINGHVFCRDESLQLPSKEEMIKMVLENEWARKKTSEAELLEMEETEIYEEWLTEDYGYYDVPECVCPICQFMEYSEYDLSAYLLKEYGVPRDEVFAEIKAINKRRKKLYENEYITYVCKKFDLNPTEIVASWKEKFGTYKEFKNWLR